MGLYSTNTIKLETNIVNKHSVELMTTENKSRELQVQHFNPSAKLKDVQPHFHTSNVQTGLKKHISLSQTTEQPVF